MTGAKRRTERRSGCPLNVSVEIFCDRWSLLVVRDLMLTGALSFKDLMAGGEGIATNILAQRLHQLTLEGIIDKVQMASDRRKHLYRLTTKGIDLAPVLQAMMVWGARHERTAAPPSAIREMTSQPDLFLMKVRKQWEEERARLDRKDQMPRLKFPVRKFEIRRIL